MRRAVAALLAALCFGSLAPAPASAAVTSEEWRWMTLAAEKDASGDLDGAMEYWRKLVASLKTHNYDACGNYAQKLGRALDKQGRYAEAVAAFEDEFYCWGQFPDRQEWVLWDARRVEQIRPEVRAFVARPTAPEARRPLAKHEPLFGTMLGGTIDNDPAVGNKFANIAKAYGKSYAMVLVYAHWNQGLPVVSTREAKNAGAALQVGWEPTLGLDAVKDDQYVRDFARSLKEYGHPVFLRYASEMNGSWTAWHGDPALYREKFRLIARIMREEAPNVAMVWAPNYVGESDANLDDYYPGDEWVDWVGVNAYHEAYFLGDPGQSQMMNDLYYQGKRTNPLDKIKEIYAKYSKRKPIMLAETGFGWATRKPHIREDAWAADALRRFYGYAPLLYPRLKAISYFNVDFVNNPQIPSTGHYLISGNAALSSAFKAATRSDWYMAQPGASPSVFWRPMEQSTLLGETRVAAYVNLVGGASRVEYLLDDKLAATATALPWEASLNLSGLTGVHRITVRAYDKEGRLGAERTYTFDPSAIRVDLNGRFVDFDQPPVQINGRTLVPARAILEALGAEIEWEPGTQTVIAKRNGDVIRLQIDNPVPTRNGRALTALEVPGQIIGGRTLVPVRFFAENYQMDVKWDDITRTVMIRPL